MGEIRKNNKGTPMKIVAARKQSDIDVQFLDSYGYIKSNSTYINFRKGQISNPYDKTVSSIGFLGVGKHKAFENNKHTVAYNSWKRMIERCYCTKQKLENSSYYGICTVCDEWFNYQSFATWFEESYYKVNERLHIDKDILYPRNTLYSPDRCLLVPQKINEQFHYRPKDTGLPTGIRLMNSGKYSAMCNSKSLGTYSTIFEAFDVYAKEKERVIKQIADEYKESIPTKVYDALYEYKVELKNDKCYKAA